jgi:hypothetical protein
MTRFHQSGRRDTAAGGSAPLTQWQREKMRGPILPMAAPKKRGLIRRLFH